MSQAKVLSAMTISVASLGGWIAGSTYEKVKNNKTGPTVFAASPISTIGDSKVVLPDVIPAGNSKVPTVNRTGQIMRFGFPGFDNLKALDDYVLSYDRRNRTAHWVFEHFTIADLKPNDRVDRTKCSFQEDKSIHQFFRATSNDYKGSGFDRGHLAAAGNHRKSQHQCDQTFLLSNIAPQVGKGFNRDAWNKLEKYVRHLAKFYLNVYVCTGPLYLPRKEPDGKTYVKYQVIGPNNVAVPTHFFKVVVGETDKHQFEVDAFVMPNQVIDDNASIFAYQVPLESVERAAGLLFFDKIPRDSFKRINGRKIAFS